MRRHNDPRNNPNDPRLNRNDPRLNRSQMPGPSGSNNFQQNTGGNFNNTLSLLQQQVQLLMQQHHSGNQQQQQQVQQQLIHQQQRQQRELEHRRRQEERLKMLQQKLQEQKQLQEQRRQQEQKLKQLQHQQRQQRKLQQELKLPQVQQSSPQLLQKLQEEQEKQKCAQRFQQLLMQQQQQQLLQQQQQNQKAAQVFHQLLQQQQKQQQQQQNQNFPLPQFQQNQAKQGALQPPFLPGTSAFHNVPNTTAKPGLLGAAPPSVQSSSLPVTNIPPTNIPPPPFGQNINAFSGNTNSLPLGLGPPLNSSASLGLGQSINSNSSLGLAQPINNNVSLGLGPPLNSNSSFGVGQSINSNASLGLGPPLNSNSSCLGPPINSSTGLLGPCPTPLSSSNTPHVSKGPTPVSPALLPNTSTSLHKPSLLGPGPSHKHLGNLSGLPSTGPLLPTPVGAPLLPNLSAPTPGSKSSHTLHKVKKTSPDGKHSTKGSKLLKKSTGKTSSKTSDVKKKKSSSVSPSSKKTKTKKSLASGTLKDLKEGKNRVKKSSSSHGPSKRSKSSGSEIKSRHDKSTKKKVKSSRKRSASVESSSNKRHCKGLDKGDSSSSSEKLSSKPDHDQSIDQKDSIPESDNIDKQCSNAISDMVYELSKNDESLGHKKSTKSDSVEDLDNIMIRPLSRPDRVKSPDRQRSSSRSNRVETPERQRSSSSSRSIRVETPDRQRSSSSRSDRFETQDRQRSSSSRSDRAKSPDRQRSSLSRSSSSSRLDRASAPKFEEQDRSPEELSQYRLDLIRQAPEKIPPDPGLGLYGMDDMPNDYEEDEEDDEDLNTFTRSCPADRYFTRNRRNCNMDATPKMIELETRFEREMAQRMKLKGDGEPMESMEDHHKCSSGHNHHHHHHHHHHKCGGGDSSSSSSSEDEGGEDDEEAGSQIIQEWEKRRKHPQCMHPELWFNLKGQANDGLLCRCSMKSRQSGIRHDVYPGETALFGCDPESNNLDKLYHYRMTMSPSTNFLTKVPTLIQHDHHEYIFEGFSILSHVPLDNVPPCKLLRFNIEYTINIVKEDAPENFTIRSLNLFSKYIFSEILELVDLNWNGPRDKDTNTVGCQRFHLLPRFCRRLPDSGGGKEMLSMNTVLNYLLHSIRPLFEEGRRVEIMTSSEAEWHARVDRLRGMIVLKPGMRPAAIRVDQIDRKVTKPVTNPGKSEGEDDTSRWRDNSSRSNIDDDYYDYNRWKFDRWQRDRGTQNVSGDDFQRELEAWKALRKKDGVEPLRWPLIIHQGNRPAQLSYAGDPQYRKAWKAHVKFRHLLNSKPKVLPEDKMKLKEMDEKLRDIRMKKAMKREVTVEISSHGFLSTGVRADLCQHALMVPVLMSHLRFHTCLGVLEDAIGYKFEDRSLLQLSLTHTSYRTNFGTNPDHARNSLTNCGMRILDYGDRRIHYQNTRKRGICILVDIMSRMGKQEETVSDIPHNERLEFLGDAVIEFLTSVHLFYMFPWLEEGGLTTFRMALVQNQHLAIVAKKLRLQEFMLYVHGPDLCHESDLRHAMANCCEAIIGALFLDGGINVADDIFSRALFDDEDVLLKTWKEFPKHMLQHEEPGGDRHWIKSSPILQKLEKFEDSLGIKFTHIRLLARAFTHRNVGVNPLTRGHNQRLEFLGDTVLQLVASEYLYRHYPEHHEGHLSLLRSSLVNSRTQGLVYNDLGMSQYVIYNDKNAADSLDMKIKQRADILESFVGALYVDKDLDYCRTFCEVCFFPRLKDFILNQDWNDPKSQLQQCCLTLREVGGGEPDIPVYKVIESLGPTNTRRYVVAVYFRGKRLATGTGHNIQRAEMEAATEALKQRAELFPILQHQRRFLERVRKGESVDPSKFNQPSSSQPVSNVGDDLTEDGGAVLPPPSSKNVRKRSRTSNKRGRGEGRGVRRTF